MFQRLPIALAKVKAAKKIIIRKNYYLLLSENLLIAWSSYQSREITKNEYNNIIKSIQILTWILYIWTQKILKLLNLMF